MLMHFFVPETYSPVLLREKARKLRKETGDQRWYASIDKMDRSVSTVSALSHLGEVSLMIDRPTISISAFHASHFRAHVSQSLHSFRHPSRHTVPLFWCIQSCFHQQLWVQTLAGWAFILWHIGWDDNRCCNDSAVSSWIKLHKLSLHLLPYEANRVCRWRWNYDRLITQHERQSGLPGSSEPEYRLPPAIIGAPLVPVGLFWFGWTTCVPPLSACVD